MDYQFRKGDHQTCVEPQNPNMSSRLVFRSGGQATCFAVNPDGFVEGQYVGLLPYAVSSTWKLQRYHVHK